MAFGQFESPESADILVTMPAEVFLQVYSGEASVSLISRMIFRGKISVNFSTSESPHAVPCQRSRCRFGIMILVALVNL